MAKIELNNSIRRLRFEHDEMTQQELANRVGVTRQTILAIEAGKYSPSLMLAFRIARVFGLRVEEVFEYQEHEGKRKAQRNKADKETPKISPRRHEVHEEKTERKRTGSPHARG